MISVSINNTKQSFEKGSTVLSALETLGYENNEMLGVALNQVFVPKEQWAEEQLKDNDRVDILNPVSGG